ncbi:hypothetical protein [Metabacillus sp. Hm71]|uniref:hypothetical protein n=1 Tax=Metabacillus sp. Hm71 TaxID=3450743 RepID=UPI003F425C2E
MYVIELTKEEVDAGLIQIGARLDALKEIQKEEAKKENIKRVLEIEEFTKPIRSMYEKLQKERYK